MKLKVGILVLFIILVTPSTVVDKKVNLGNNGDVTIIKEYDTNGLYIGYGNTSSGISYNNFTVSLNNPFNTVSVREKKRFEKAGDVGFYGSIEGDVTVINNSFYHNIIKDDSETHISYSRIEPKEYNNFIVYSNTDNDLWHSDAYINRSFGYFFGQEVEDKPPVFVVSRNSSLSEKIKVNYPTRAVYSGNAIIVKDIPDVEQDVVHEMVHFYNDRLGMDEERWLNEGIAEYHERIFERASSSKILSYRGCLNFNCYSYYRPSPHLSILYNSDDPTDEKYLEKYTSSYYDYSMLIVANRIQNTNPTLKEEVDMIQRGVEPSKVFDTKFCSTEECVQDVRRKNR